MILSLGVLSRLMSDCRTDTAAILERLVAAVQWDFASGTRDLPLAHPALRARPTATALRVAQKQGTRQALRVGSAPVSRGSSVEPVCSADAGRGYTFDRVGRPWSCASWWPVPAVASRHAGSCVCVRRDQASPFAAASRAKTPVPAFQDHGADAATRAQALEPRERAAMAVAAVGLITSTVLASASASPPEETNVNLTSALPAAFAATFMLRRESRDKGIAHAPGRPSRSLPKARWPAAIRARAQSCWLALHRTRRSAASAASVSRALR